MSNTAYLFGISHYPDHVLTGVPNDLALMQRALIHQGFDPSAIHIFGDDQATRAGLHTALGTMRDNLVATTNKADKQTCFVYFSSSGILSIDPLAGGIQPIDGDALNFSTALSFAMLNDYLPVRPDLPITVVLDCWHSNLAADSLSADITLVTIGGAEKFACLTGETLITEADGRQVRYGQLSWVLGQALLRGAPGCPWSEILHEMTDLIRWQQLPLMVTFHGQITGPVGDLDHSQLLFNSGQIGGLS